MQENREKEGVKELETFLEKTLKARQNCSGPTGAYDEVIWKLRERIDELKSVNADEVNRLGQAIGDLVHLSNEGVVFKPKELETLQQLSGQLQTLVQDQIRFR